MLTKKNLKEKTSVYFLNINLLVENCFLGVSLKKFIDISFFRILFPLWLNP